MSINTVCEEMRAISSHRDYRSSKMRVLILSAFLACAAAAPSGFLAPVAVPALAYPAILPTISPGDIQAAAIEAQVKAQDLAIAAIDKARLHTDLAVENLNDKTEVSNDEIKEKVTEQFWSAEDKKWQALDALKTAEAQIDGSIANNAEVLAKSALGTTFVLAPNVAVVPIASAPVSPVYTPGIIAPTLKAEAKGAQEVTEVKEEKSEALVKSAEDATTDTVAVEAVKTEENIAEVKSVEDKPLVAPVTAPLVAEPYRFPIVAPIVLPQVLKYGAVPYGVQTLGLGPQTLGLAPQALGLAPTLYNAW